MILCGAGGGKFFIREDFYGLLTVSGLTMLMAAVYLLNQIRDIENDRINNKLFFLSDEIITKKNVFIYFSVLTVSGVLCLILSSNWSLSLSVAGILIVTGGMYNLGKTALKNRAWGSIIITALGGAGLLVIGWFLAVRGFPLDWLELGAYTCAFTATGLMTMIPDRKGDELTGKITFSVKYGKLLTARVGSILCMSAVVIAIIQEIQPLIIAASCSLPFFFWASVVADNRAVNLAVKISIFALSVAIAVLNYPLYLIAMIIYFPVARIYYKKRFKITYPSFTLNNY
ncbi:MAG: UbiA family prenyltransferase [Candidatus Electryonea clarkiae]|nr:UbiA family prenyltransferase [Candidatus Electryonea clarkiae]